MEENGRLIKFLYNEDREVVAEETSNGTITRYIRGLGIISSDSEEAKTYYHYVSDEQGSITHVLSEDAEILNHYSYDAFGNIIEKTEKVENRFCYNGEMLDPVTQQYYLRARFYNPVIGRFTQEDTYYGDGLKLYQYCQANPVGYVDPSGHNCGTTQSRYNSDEEQHPKANAAGGYQSATEKGNSKTSYGKSREIIQCNTKDAAADELAKRIGGQSRSAFADDPIQREFDVISDQYIAQAKPPLKCVNKTVRTQMKATFEAAKKYERKVYYQFEGIPSQEVLDKLYEYSERYGVEVIIDTEPLGILN